LRTWAARRRLCDSALDRRDDVSGVLIKSCASEGWRVHVNEGGADLQAIRDRITTTPMD